jgi:hypothetical protein
MVWSAATRGKVGRPNRSWRSRPRYLDLKPEDCPHAADALCPYHSIAVLLG